VRIVFIIILIDIIIFTTGALFSDKELIVYPTEGKKYHLDRYGYYWRVDE